VSRSAAWVAAALMLLGAMLRLRPYLANRSLWLDESFLALNLVERSFGQLWQPLDHLQAAPLGFLAIERLAIASLGASEYALRLFPLLCGLASLILLWDVARRLLSPPGALLALAMLAISERLIYYAVEVKPYSVDVAVALLLWWAFVRWDDEVGAPLRVLLPTGVLGAVAVWLSYPSVLVLGGIGLRWLWVPLRARQWSALALRAVVSGTWVLSFVTVYLVAMRDIGGNPLLRDVWRPAAAPLLPRSLADLTWYVDATATIGSLPLGRAVAALVVLAVVVGALARRDLLVWVAGPLVLSWLAAGLERYPLAARLWLFMTPFIIVLTAAGLADTWRRARTAAPVLAPALAVLLLAQPALSAARDAIRPRGVEEVRPLLSHAQKSYRPGDALYLYYWTEFPARYYALRGLGFPGEVIVGAVGGRDSTEEYEGDVRRLHGRGRVWLLFSHVQSPHGLNEEALFLRNARRVGQELDARHLTGASLYLYDLSSTTR
jgi:Dolichyl-phosphate-mannose-protein mannosyltransferase